MQSRKTHKGERAGVRALLTRQRATTYLHCSHTWSNRAFQCWEVRGNAWRREKKKKKMYKSNDIRMHLRNLLRQITKGARGPRARHSCRVIQCQPWCTARPGAGHSPPTFNVHICEKGKRGSFSSHREGLILRINTHTVLWKGQVLRTVIKSAQWHQSCPTIWMHTDLHTQESHLHMANPCLVLTQPLAGSESFMKPISDHVSHFGLPWIPRLSLPIPSGSRSIPAEGTWVTCHSLLKCPIWHKRMPSLHCSGQDKQVEASM